MFRAMKDWFTIVFMRCFLFFLWLLPEGALNLLLKAIFKSPFFKKSKQYRRAQENIYRVFGLPPHSEFAHRFILHNFMTQVKCVLESFWDSVKFEGVEDFKRNMEICETFKESKLMISGHIGSWEFNAKFGKLQTKLPFYALAKPQNSKALNVLVGHLREKWGVKLLWTGRQNFQRELIKLSRQDVWLGFVMDQKPAGNQGEEVLFFGQPVSFVVGPGVMAARNGNPVLGVCCVRQSKSVYRLISRILYPPHHNCTDPRQITVTCAAFIEEMIRLYPEQWTWNYKRW